MGIKVIKRYRETGLVLLGIRIVQKVWRTSISFVMARRMNTDRMFVDAGALVTGMRYIKLGKNFRAMENLWLEAIESYRTFTYKPTIIIGDNASLSRNVHIGAIDRVEIGDDVLIGSNVLITDHNHGSYSGDEQSSPNVPPVTRKLVGKPVKIGSRVWLGDGVIVGPGTTIGEGSVVGAHSVVTRSIPPSCVAAGTPATVIKRYDKNKEVWINE